MMHASRLRSARAAEGAVPRSALLLALALSMLPAIAGAGTAPSRTQILLTQCPSRESLRASLIAYADSIQPSQPPNAGLAMFYAGVSYSRASLRDSAIACFERAVSTQGGDEERLALVDGLLMRRREGDLDAALAILEPAARQARTQASPAADDYQARLGWAELLAGRTDRALELFKPLEAALDLDPVWGYRMARVFVEAGEVKRAIGALSPLAIACRQHDEEIMALAGRAFEPFGDKSRLESGIRREIASRDRDEAKLIQRLGGRRVLWSAPDGYALGGVVAAPTGEKRRRAAVVLWAPGDTLESYDSLTVALNRAGWALMLMQARGSGWSASPACPFPDAWEGREDALQEICARDVREALRALSLAATIDTTRYLVVGVGRTAPIAVEAAQGDPRVSALLLLSPLPAAVERGTMRERIRLLKLPIYFANAPEDFPQFELTETMYQSGDRGRSRVADVRSAGSGARPFRRDGAALQRLVAWAEESVPAKAPAPRGGKRTAR